jgi:ribosomal protein L37AE/L43A
MNERTNPGCDECKRKGLFFWDGVWYCAACGKKAIEEFIENAFNARYSKNKVLDM